MKKFVLHAGEHQDICLTESGEYVVELTGNGASVNVEGVFDATQIDVIDISLTIVHTASHTSAKTVLKGVAREHASVRFFGLIRIGEGYKDIQSFLEERVLLLSQTARAEAIPELEILSNDVKCSHAASITQIPAEHLFYLESRGIPKMQAEDMIIEGFLERGEHA